MYGYAAGEMIGRSISALVPADRRPEYESILSRVARGERLDGIDTFRLTKSGASIEVSLTVWPIRGAGDEVVGASVVVVLTGSPP